MISRIIHRIRRHIRKSSTARERGMVTLALLGLVVPLVVVVFAFISLSSRQIGEHNTRTQFHTADSLANSGLDLSLVALAADGTFSHANAKLEDGGVDYQVVDRWTDADSNFLRIVSTGFTNPRLVAGAWTESASSVSSTITGIVRERTFDYDLREAIFLQDSNVKLNLNGQAFLFNGNDKNYLGGGSGPDGARHAIATVAAPSVVKSQISSKQWPNIQGLGGTPSIQQRSNSNTLVKDLIDFYKSSATLRLTDGTNINNADLGNASQNRFQITYGTGTVKLGGSSQGAGMLLVVGDLEISGSFQYTGIVAVLGQVIFNGGGSNNNKIVDGTLLIGDNVSAGELRTNGNITVQYSSQAVTRAKGLSGQYSLEAMMHGRVD
jgi:hypothetical protein